jgi:hypothetical protein
MACRHLLSWTLGAVLAGATLSGAAARPPQNADPTLAGWFHDLHQPSSGMSCCDVADGHILADEDWRIEGDTYQVRINGDWREVPHAVVLDRADNPTGSPVAFWSPMGGNPPIYCFIRPPQA